jgi:hypothetical protein
MKILIPFLVQNCNLSDSIRLVGFIKKMIVGRMASRLDTNFFDQGVIPPIEGLRGLLINPQGQLSLKKWGLCIVFWFLFLFVLFLLPLGGEPACWG